jgi:hypothetical protein
MSKRLTVFYSWQSDTPHKFNREFIEAALLETINRLHLDAVVVSALRDAKIELDKDTKGVAGSPPVAETILRKIDECSVFVADLTFVGKSLDELRPAEGQSRKFPNPNVLIEYGYALKKHTHEAIVGIMNAAYGEPSAESLPFDLRHLLWPKTYNLTATSEHQTNLQFEALIAELTDALKLILVNRFHVIESASKFLPQKSTKNAAVFFDNAENLIFEKPFKAKMEPYTVPDKGAAYLRLYPDIAVPSFDSELEALNAARTSSIVPMGEMVSGQGYGYSRNDFGAIAYAAPADGNLYNFTQLFLSREIWGVDAFCVNSEICRMNTTDPSVAVFDPIYIEEIFIRALNNYWTAAQKHLQLPLPWHIEAGLVGIKHYKIPGSFTGSGRAIQNTVHRSEKVVSHQQTAIEILKPFFKLIWAKFGIERPQKE